MIVNGKNIRFSYESDVSRYPALKDISLSIRKGELIFIVGCNGCGKSTLVKHLNALLRIQHGELRVSEIDVGNERDIWRLRRICGMVFQNPDNQFVSSVIEDDIAFGLENYEVERGEIVPRVRTALEAVGMQGYEKRSPHSLSGGQKQRAALAGVLVLDPEILIFDEATSMLDPEGRREVLETVQKLHNAGKTIIMVTHYIEEAVIADRIILMSKGTILACGTPRDVLTARSLMEQAEITPPMPVLLYYDLKDAGIILSRCPLTNTEFAEEICQL